MVIASHGIFTLYGFWLPNEERGSWSDFVRSWELLRYGKATKIDERYSVASEPYDKPRRLEAAQLLKYKPVSLSGIQARAVARGFARAIEEGGYELAACSILPTHVHMICRRHERPVERIIGHLKARATQQLRAENLHPFERLLDAQGKIPSVWTHRAWKVFIDSMDDLERVVEYVEQNPLKEGKPERHWSFVRAWEV
jgi:REP element-mobilizing transposase RayT